MRLRNIYMFKEDLALNNLQGLIGYKTPPNIEWFQVFLSYTNNF